MSFSIEPDQQLFVLAETCCRGDIDHEKFTVEFHYFQPAVNFASQPCDERDDDQLEDWLEALPEQRLSYMMNDIIIAENKDIIDKLLEDGKYLIEGEETVYAIGVTKELALEAFMSQYPITYDTWC